LDLASYPSFVNVWRGGVILNEAALVVTSTLNYGYINHLYGGLV